MIVQITTTRTEALEKLFGFTVYNDGNGTGLPTLFRPKTGTLRVDTAETQFGVSDLSMDEDDVLRIYIDRHVVEVFVNDRQAMIAHNRDYPAKTSLTSFTIGASTLLREIETGCATLPITSSHMESAIEELNVRMKGTEKFRSKQVGQSVIQLRADNLRETDPVLKSFLVSAVTLFGTIWPEINPFAPDVNCSLLCALLKAILGWSMEQTKHLHSPLLKSQMGNFRGLTP